MRIKNKTIYLCQSYKTNSDFLRKIEQKLIIEKDVKVLKFHKNKETYTRDKVKNANITIVIPPNGDKKGAIKDFTVGKGQANEIQLSIGLGHPVYVVKLDVFDNLTFQSLLGLQYIKDATSWKQDYAKVFVKETLKLNKNKRILILK